MKHITVVAAVIEHNEKYLCVQRGINKYEYISKKWEFPGGKVEVGESHEDALIREIQEELSMQISDLKFFVTVQYSYPDFHLTMHTFLCKSDQSSPTLTEHLQYAWRDASDINHLDWAAADLPVVKKLLTRA
jgi:8-oxo-dGTP diphosphatase